VFVHHSFRKNLHNQVAAALILENAMVHVHDDHDFEYLQSGQRLLAHPFTESYDDFLNVVGSMTLNFYVTFSECYGLLIAESLSMGVPCLASNSGGFFDYDEYLAKALIVEDYDNSESIYKKAKEVLANRDEIAARGKEYVKKLNAIAREKLSDFLNH
jgi:glycosyltransferase involved in cell wall biosynthesis